jgi:aerotaxis receptor
MRQNLPVTQREYPFPADATLMSTTDVHSHLTYANDAFVEVSGFTAEEMAGQPHNIVRHPDMPREAFADMWATLKAGQAWTALVKNRRKDGDHYWVRANATPVVRGGQVTGYMSVRTKPGADEVRESEAMYQRFREGRARHLAFHRGLIVHTGWRAWMSWGRTASLGSRLHAPLWLAAAAVGGVALASGAWAPAAVAAGAAATLSLWFERQVAVPLRQVLRQAQAVASGQPGDNVNLQRVDEIGMMLRAVNQAGLNLRSLVDDVAGQVGGVREVSRTLSQGSSDLQQRTEQAGARLQETASSMEQMTSSVSSNSAHAQDASALAERTLQAASEGSTVVGHVVERMGEITRSAQRIGDIIGLIDGIAFQTNILALNAAVEAARAGEQGRGFAVVAGEVRQLAQRSAEAAREIKTLIGTSLEQVKDGSASASSAGDSVQGILKEVQRVADLVRQISAATAQQAAGIGEVNAAVGELDRMTQQNAALVEHSGTAAADLRQRADRLAEALGVFHTR